MANRVQIMRSNTAAKRPAAGTYQPGELYVNFADAVIGYIDQAQNPIDLKTGGVTYAATAPTGTVKAGDLWYRTIAPVGLMVYTGSAWIDTTAAPGKAQVDYGPTTPGTPQTGDLWYKTTATAGLYLWDGAAWVSATGLTGGPFLPLAGGNVTGVTTFADQVHLTDGSTGHNLRVGKPAARHSDVYDTGFVSFDEVNNRAASLGYDDNLACAYVQNNTPGTNAAVTTRWFKPGDVIPAIPNNPGAGAGHLIQFSSTADGVNFQSAVMVVEQNALSFRVGGDSGQAARTDSLFIQAQGVDINTGGFGTSAITRDKGDARYVLKVSDRRLKENIEAVTDDMGLSTVNALTPVSFDWINGKQDRIGMIAQDVQKILPAAVSDSENSDILGIDPLTVIAVLVKSIQELTARLETLEGAS